MAKLWTLKDKQLLIVDDFPAMRSMLRSIVTGFGANKIKEARNGEEAIAQLAAQTIDIVLCDYNLGEGKDGQQVLEEAIQRELLPYSSIFVMTTAENTSEMVMGAFEYQPDDYLIKPYNKQVLQLRIRKLQEKKAGLKFISKAMERNDFITALSLCTEKLTTDTKYKGELIKLKGQLLMRLSEYKLAQEHYEMVLRGHEIGWAKFGLGQALFYQKSYIEAKEIFEDLISSNNKFVLAYDWLAKIELAMGDTTRSQQLLTKAVSISPKAILRQKALAEVSFGNGDIDLAEKSYKHVVRAGKNSIYKSPSDYGGLAKVYVEKKSNIEAAKILGSMKEEFRNADHKTELETTVIESLIYHDLGRSEESAAAVDRATLLLEQEPGALSSDTAMELANACFKLGKMEQAGDLIKHVVRNHHEDAEILQKAKQIFDANGQGDEGESLIQLAKQEVVDINNNGVNLAKQGKLQESLGLFLKAAKSMPENLIVNLNAAQSFIMHLQKNGVTEKQLAQVRVFLDRARSIDANNERYQKLKQRYDDLSRKVA